MATTGDDYDTAERWTAAYDWAVAHGADEDKAYDFADHTGGDGGELTIDQCWLEWRVT
jgi:hypothetical protein